MAPKVVHASRASARRIRHARPAALVRKAFSLDRNILQRPARSSRPAAHHSARCRANQLGSFGPWVVWGLLVFCCIFGRVCPLSCRRSGDPSGRGHVVVPRGRARSGLPARASLAHSDPLVSSSVAFCWALYRVRCSWGRYIRPQEWTLGSKPRVVAVKPRATLLLSDGASCLSAASYVRLTPSCVVTLCD